MLCHPLGRYWFHLTISRLPFFFFHSSTTNLKNINQQETSRRARFSRNDGHMSFKQEKFVYGFTNLYDIFLETKHGQNLSWGDRLATSKFHGPKCCTINKPPTSQQATRRALQSGHSLKTTGTPNSAACSFQAVVGMYWETL